MKTYQNAGKILPEELFNEVKKIYTGSLYIPHEDDRYARKKIVIALWKQNASAKEIALIAGIGIRRVHQIIAEERHNNAFLGCQKFERMFACYNQQEREERTAVPS